jgi:aldose 1-epimerase
MQSQTLQGRNLRLLVLPEAGASIIAFDGRFGDTWQPLMRPSPPAAVSQGDVSRLASFNLVPWSNRVTGAAFTFEGQRYYLRANTPQGFAIHGDARERPWQVTGQSSDSLTCTLNSRDFADFNFPFPFTAEIRYTLHDWAFETTLTLTNVGTSDMPAGFGFHPYFNRGFGGHDGDEVRLQFSARGVYPPLPGMAVAPIDTSSGAHQLPDGSFTPIPPVMDFSSLTPIGSRDIDHCFGGWDGRAAIDYPSTGVQLRFECDPTLGHVILYTPPGKPFFALEPVSHANNGFNLLAAGVPGNGIQVLPPGASMRGSFTIRVSEMTK